MSAVMRWSLRFAGNGAELAKAALRRKPRLAGRCSSPLPRSHPARTRSGATVPRLQFSSERRTTAHRQTRPPRGTDNCRIGKERWAPMIAVRADPRQTTSLAPPAAAQDPRSTRRIARRECRPAHRRTWPSSGTGRPATRQSGVGRERFVPSSAFYSDSPPTDNPNRDRVQGRGSWQRTGESPYQLLPRADR